MAPPATDLARPEAVLSHSTSQLASLDDLPTFPPARRWARTTGPCPTSS
jgi:hypothetical protein